MSGHLAPGFTPYRLDSNDAFLAANESPEPVAEQIRAAIIEATGLLNRYPDPGILPLRKRLADRFEVDTGQVLIGPGASELLFSIAHWRLATGDAFVYGWPSYYAYPQIAKSTGAVASAVELDRGQAHDMDAMSRAIDARTRLVCVCNPNNPTGTALAPDAIARFAAALPQDVLLVVDEAYWEFSSISRHEDSMALLAARPATVLVRTFSKAWGLAGLRVGYAIFGSAATARAVDGIRPTFPIGQAAEAGALAALDLETELHRQVAAMRVRRDRLITGLRALAFRVHESQTNFVWVEIADAYRSEQLVAEAESQGVHVAGGPQLCGRPGLRITVGADDEIDTALNVFGKLREQEVGEA